MDRKGIILMKKLLFILLLIASTANAEFTTDTLKIKDGSGDVCSITGTFTANRSLTLPDQSGTLCTTGSVCSGYQGTDSELTALAGLTSAANALPYFTGSGTASTTTLSAFGRSVIDDADAATAQSTLGLAIGTNVQAYDADLTTWAGITPGANVGTFLGTPSSANFATMCTDETGSGSVVLGTNPTISMASGSLLLPSSTSLPGTCSTGQIYMDTDATSGQRLYACESANTWVLQGDGGGGGSGDVTAVGDCTTGACFDGTTGTTLTFNNAGGDATIVYDGTDVEFNKAVKVAGTTANMLYVTGTSYPVEFVERTPSGSSGAWATQKLKTTYSAADVTAEFGPVTIWAFQDIAAVENGLGYIGALRSGNDTSGAVVLGTFNSGVQGEKLRITPSGSVGIGTTAPDTILDVNAATGGTLQLTYNDADGTAATYARMSVDSSGRMTIAPTANTLYSSSFFTVDNGEGLAFGGVAATAATSVRGSQSTSQIDLYTGGTQKLSLDSNGDVGIGNTAPVYKLEVGDVTAGANTTFSAATGAVAVSYSANSTKFIGENTGADGASSGSFVALVQNDATAVTSGDRLGGFQFGGYDGVDRTRLGGAIVAYANGTYSATAAPTKIDFEVASATSATRAAKLTVDESKITIKDVLNIQPRASAPTPAAGDIYVDSTAGELCYYDGAAWQGISTGTDANCS